MLHPLPPLPLSVLVPFVESYTVSSSEYRLILCYVLCKVPCIHTDDFVQILNNNNLKKRWALFTGLGLPITRLPLKPRLLPWKLLIHLWSIVVVNLADLSFPHNRIFHKIVLCAEFLNLFWSK